ncbi:MAG: MFS transporter [Deltaproteobacteria bacterium]|nr:MFS transporter [Deltaproteobacteria bacterium]
MKKILGFSKPVFVLGVVSLLTDLSSEMIYPILPLFLANVIGASTTFIGLIEGIAESTASLLKVFSGWLSDKLNKRRQLILSGYGLSSVVKPFLALATSGWHVLGLRFADRLGKGIRGAPRDALIADATEPSERGKAFGFHRAMDTVGAILGPAATFMILPFFDHTYRPLFLIAAIPALAAVAVIIFSVKDMPRISNEAVKNIQGSKKFDASFIILLGIIAIFTLGNSSDAFLILRAQNVGIKPLHIPILWLFFNLIYTVVSVPAGKLSDIIGRKRIIFTGFIVYSACYAGFAFASEWWHAWALFGIYGIYYGTTEGVIKAYISDIVSAEVRATSFGIYNFVTGIILFPANLLTGWIWKAYGATYAFGLGAVLACIAASAFALFSIIHKRSKLAPQF